MSLTPPRITYLISRYPAVSHTFIQREITALSENGFSIDVASINDADPGCKDDTQEVFYVKRAGFIKAFLALFRAFIYSPIRFFHAWICVFQLSWFDLNALLYHFFYLGEAALVGRWMHRTGSTHLHVHFANPASTVALLVTKLYPFTFSMTIHGPDEFYDVTANKLVQKFAEARFICCIGYYARSQVMRLLVPSQWSKIEITPMGVDPSAYPPTIFRENPSPFNLVCIGRLTRNKGQQVLLEALARILKQGLSIHLYLVGDGPDRNLLEQTVNALDIAQHVTFTGPLSQDQIRPFLSNADLFVLPSFAEGIPVSLMEAMSMEIPCISTWINGIPELISSGFDGILLYPSDVDGLEREIRHLFQNSALRRQLGINARKTILKKWTLNENVQSIAEAFKKYES